MGFVSSEKATVDPSTLLAVTFNRSRAPTSYFVVVKFSVVASGIGSHVPST